MDDNTKTNLITYLRFKLALETIHNSVKLGIKNGIKEIMTQLTKQTVNYLITKQSFKLMKMLNYSTEKIYLYEPIKKDYGTLYLSY